MSKYPSKLYRWYNQKGPLNQKQMEYNANNLYDYFVKTCGWTKNALAGILGNMESESTINPACWQGWKTNPVSLTLYMPPSIPQYSSADDYFDKYTYAGDGFGLVQWTQQRKFLEWYFLELGVPLERYYYAQQLVDYEYRLVDGSYTYVTKQDNYSYRGNGYMYELYRLLWEVENDVQWTSSIYNQTFEEFVHSDEPAYDLGVKFLHAYEKPAEFHDEIRGGQAAKWYEFLGGVNPRLFAPWMCAKKPYWLNGNRTTW